MKLHKAGPASLLPLAGAAPAIPFTAGARQMDDLTNGNWLAGWI